MMVQVARAVVGDSGQIWFGYQATGRTLDYRSDDSQ
jgi:hypothetical protein